MSPTISPSPQPSIMGSRDNQKQVIVPTKVDPPSPPRTRFADHTEVRPAPDSARSTTTTTHAVGGDPAFVVVEEPIIARRKPRKVQQPEPEPELEDSSPRKELGLEMHRRYIGEYQTNPAGEASPPEPQPPARPLTAKKPRLQVQTDALSIDTADLNSPLGKERSGVFAKQSTAAGLTLTSPMVTVSQNGLPVIPELDVKNMRWSPSNGLEPASAPVAIGEEKDRTQWDLPGGQVRRSPQSFDDATDLIDVTPDDLDAEVAAWEATALAEEQAAAAAAAKLQQEKEEEEAKETAKLEEAKRKASVEAVEAESVRKAAAAEAEAASVQAAAEAEAAKRDAARMKSVIAQRKAAKAEEEEQEKKRRAQAEEERLAEEHAQRERARAAAMVAQAAAAAEAKAEQERLAAERAAAEQLRLTAEREQLAAAQAERQRVVAEAAEVARISAEDEQTLAMLPDDLDTDREEEDEELHRKTSSGSDNMYRTETAVSTDVIDMVNRKQAEEEPARRKRLQSGVNTDVIDGQSTAAVPAGIPPVPAAAIGAKIPTKYLDGLTDGTATAGGVGLSLAGLERLDEVNVSQSPAPRKLKPAAEAACESGAFSQPLAGATEMRPPSAFWPVTMNTAVSVLQKLETQPDKFKRAVSLARQSAVLCRAAIKRANASSGPLEDDEKAGVLAEVLLAAAEVTAYGLVVMGEAVEASTHASVRSALVAKKGTMAADMASIEEALARVPGAAVGTPPRDRMVTQSSVASDDTWDTPRQVSAFEGVEMPLDTPR